MHCFGKHLFKLKFESIIYLTRLKDVFRDFGRENVELGFGLKPDRERERQREG